MDVDVEGRKADQRMGVNEDEGRKITGKEEGRRNVWIRQREQQRQGDFW